MTPVSSSLRPIRPKRPAGRGLLAAALALLLPACATQQTGTPPPPSTVSARDCLVFFDELDRVVHVAGTRDGGEHRVAGFPYLRVDRFTASFRNQVAEEARFHAWVQRMRALDARARGFEIANLPDGAFPIMLTLDR